MKAQVAEQITCDGYELFRRAIEEHNEDAWAESVARYRPLLITWARRSITNPLTAEHPEDLADQAFARAWIALSAARFTTFPNLASILSYLRRCVGATMIDHARARIARERIDHKLEPDAILTPEQAVLGAVERDELWSIVNRLVATAQERAVLIERFVYDIPPRAIAERFPDLFPDVQAVYIAKRNLLQRLRRTPELRRLDEDRFAA